MEKYLRRRWFHPCRYLGRAGRSVSSPQSHPRCHPDPYRCLLGWSYRREPPGRHSVHRHPCPSVSMTNQFLLQPGRRYHRYRRQRPHCRERHHRQCRSIRWRPGEIHRGRQQYHHHRHRHQPSLLPHRRRCLTIPTHLSGTRRHHLRHRHCRYQPRSGPCRIDTPRDCLSHPNPGLLPPILGQVQ